MSKGGSLLCLRSLVLVQVCIIIVQLLLIPSWQLTAGQQAGGELLCRDPIGRSLMSSSHGRGELDGDSIFDEDGGLSDDVDEYAASDGGGGSVPAEGEEGWLPDDDDGFGGGGAKGSSSGSGGGGGGDVECPECGKFFKNDKSMFGHLRSHPNRGYKGATPPVSKLKLSPETTAAAAAASPSSSSPSRGTHQPRPRRDPRLIPFELVGPYALLTFQCQENSHQLATQQAPPPPPPCYPGSETDVGVAKQTEGGGQISSSAVAAEAHVDEYSCSGLKIPKKRRNMLTEIREAHRKKAKVVPPLPPPREKEKEKEKAKAKAKVVPPPREKGPYICKYCYAEFSTHQALGGHMAGHHRDKKVPTLHDASSRAAHQGMAAQSQDGRLQVNDGWRDSGLLSLRRGLLSEQLSMASNVPRQSGQATEMRQQHSGRRSDGLTLAAPAPAPTPTQADDRGGRRVLDIDLNAEATEQE